MQLQKAGRDAIKTENCAVYGMAFSLGIFETKSTPKHRTRYPNENAFRDLLNVTQPQQHEHQNPLVQSSSTSFDHSAVAQG